MLTIYKASAGSGKTYTLAYEYIKLLLGVKLDGGRYVLNTPKYTRGKALRTRPHSHILAITFTNKATAEMKSRIIKELDNLSHLPEDGEKDAAYASALVKEYGCTREELAALAGHSLKRLLFDYDAFNISTIDTFFQTVLRSFAREIDRQGDFRLEIDEAYVINAAVSMLFDDVNRRDTEAVANVEKWLERMAGDFMSEGKNFNIFNRSSGEYKAIVKYISNTLDETYAANARAMSEYMSNGSRLTRFAKAVGEMVAALPASVTKSIGAVYTALSAAGAEDTKLNSNLVKLIASCRDFEMNYKKIADNFAKLSSKYMKALAGGNVDDVEHDAYKAKVQLPASVARALIDWFAVTRRACVLYKVYKTVLKEVNSLRALAYIGSYIERFRHENNMILLADTNSLLGAIISEDETPFIYERVGVELQNFLIDEFQDTSRMQWNNLRPLLSNSLATDNDSLIIGDVKQSIYRWRGGDSSLLAHEVAENDFPTNHTMRGQNPGENTNYRSAHGVVWFNNTLFRRMAAATGVDGYDGVAQSLPSGTADLTSYVRVIDMNNEDAVNYVNGTAPGSNALIALDVREQFAAAAEDGPDTASMWLTGHTIMEQHRRGYRWRDIAILCRTNGDAAEMIDYLSHNFPDIKIKSEDALYIRNSPAVRLIVTMLEMLDRSYVGDAQADADMIPGDSQRASRRVEVITDRFEYFRSHGEDTTDALRHSLDATLNEAVDADSGDSHSMLDDIAEIRALAPSNLTALVEAVIMKKIPPTQRRAEIAYIAAFVDAVNDFMSKNIPTLHAFLEYWSVMGSKLTVESPDSLDAVPVLTIHKAKGLEWDCVHVPFVKNALHKSSIDAWYRLDGFTEVDEDIRPPIMYLKGTKEFADEVSPFYSQMQQLIAGEKADTLNVAYVAFTRAVRELCINLIKPDAGETLNAVIKNALVMPPTGEDESLYIDLAADFDGCVYVKGEPTEPIAAAEEEKPERRPIRPVSMSAPSFDVCFSPLNSQVSQVDDLTLDDTADVDIGNNALVLPYTDTLPAMPHADDPQQQAINRGIDLHAILADMITYDDLDASVARRGVKLTVDHRADYERLLRDAFEKAGEYGRRWFDPAAERVLTEHSIYVPERNETYRPDRIVWTAEGTVDIVDFKFTSEVKDEHRSQVLHYRSMLRQMGYDRVRAYLWYPLLGRVIEATSV